MLRAGRWLLLAALLALAGCQPHPKEPADVSAETRAFDYAARAASGEPVYRLDTEPSRVDIVVRREGPLSRFGHDHVIVATGLEGWWYRADDPSKARAEITLHIDGFAVDPAEARQRYGLDTEPSEDDIAGTLENLRTKVLNAEAHPNLTVELLNPSAEQGDAMEAIAVFTVSGESFRHPVALENVSLSEQDSTVTVTGNTLVLQSQLGLEPFSVLGGGLRVADAMEVSWELVWVGAK